MSEASSDFKSIVNEEHEAEGRDGKARLRGVVITGFMAAGKTTVAAALARRLRCALIDLDDLIEMREGRTPREIIEGEGEEQFRKMETRALADALRRGSETETADAGTENAKTMDAGTANAEIDAGASFVIALGGGTWTIEENRALVAAHRCLTVWLDAPFALCWRRITEEGGAEVRPLAREGEAARRLYESRRAFYKMAALRVEAAEGRSAQELAEEIAAALSS